MKRRICLVLALILLLSLCACGKKEADAPQAGPGAEGETTEGWIASRIAMPDWLAHTTGWETEGDTIWISGVTPEEKLVIAAYDTLSGEWTRVDFSTGDAWQPEMGAVSLSGGSIWAIVHESNRYEDFGTANFREKLDYFILRVDRASGESTAVRIPFEGGGSSEGSGLFFSGIIGLDDHRALLGAMDRVYVIDAEANILSEPNLPIYGSFYGFRVNDSLYLWSPDGPVLFDRETLSCGEPISLENGAMLDSNRGRFLLSSGGALYSCDQTGQRKEKLFSWIDVALSLREKGERDGFENSLGDIYYPGGEMVLSSGLIRVTRGPVPVRRPLRLGGMGKDGYALNQDLQDAVIRFNNSDPEYKIEIEPLLYANEQERDRLMIELATRSDLDLLDTSLLPDKALDSGLLADMLPMIDADESICREDFIEALLELMLQNGGLYEYSARFTLLTMTTHADLFPGRENWTAANIEALIQAHPEMDPLWHSMDRKLLTTLFCWAATAEFIDRETGTCSFESPAFMHWLELMKALPAGGQYSEDPKLMNICYDLAFNVGHQEKYVLKDDYVVAGFPETEGTGSYFLKLGSSPDEGRRTFGTNTRIGILAGSENQQGAWRFVRTLMGGSENTELKDGIPVFKQSFERALEAAITDAFDERFQIGYLTEENARELREQVYGTTKLVVPDEALIRLMREEISRYYEGQIDAADTAAAIQNRARIYVSEQYG